MAQIKLDADAIRHGNPSVHVHEPKKDVKLVFNNFANTDYEVVEDDLPVSTFNETYADIFKRGLDPNIKDEQVYGMARSLKPKTVLINQMRADIDQATQDYYNLLDEESKRIAELEKVANSSNDAPTPNPTPTSDQGGNQ